MKLVIALLLYREKSLIYLPKLIPSLIRASDFLNNQECQILIGDNSGKDKSNQKFFNSYENIGGKKFEYFDFKNNLGFSKAYNQLIKRAVDLKAEYFLMINPDIYIDKLAIKNLLTEIETNQLLGSVSPKVLYWDFKNNYLTNYIDTCGIVLKPGLLFKDLGQGQKDVKQYDKINILGPSGAASLFRLKALIDVSESSGRYFDEKFFMYKEDCDLIYRLNIKNWSSKLVPDSVFYHDRTVSDATWWQKIKKRKQRTKQERIWSFLGQHYLFSKHYSSLSFLNKIIVLFRVLKMLLFIIIFEQFMLKEYYNLYILTKKR